MKYICFVFQILNLLSSPLNVIVNRSGSVNFQRLGESWSHIDLLATDRQICVITKNELINNTMKIFLLKFYFKNLFTLVFALNNYNILRESFSA